LGISLVPEERRLFPILTVEDNLRLGAYIKRVRPETQKTLEGIYERFPILSRRRRQLAGTLSGGEQQMAAIGRGLMSKPKLLMLDEPSLGLAPLIAKQVFELTKEINRDGVTVLLIEQNVHQSMRIAEEVFVLASGHVVAQGNSEELSKEEHIRSAYLGI
jgi:branched-chain amino acid transport system ATP-binding protein